MLSKCLGTSTFTDYDIFPVCDPELGGVHLVKMQDVKILEGGGAAARALDLRPGPVASLPDVLPGGGPGPHVHQTLQQTVVIERIVARGTPASTERGVKLLRLIDKPEPLDIVQLHRHSLSAIKCQIIVRVAYGKNLSTGSISLCFFS